MTSIVISAALLRTSIVSRPPRGPLIDSFERGEGTKPATRPHERQAVSVAVQGLLKRPRRKASSEERSKEIERRRKWGGAGNMPADVRLHYSEAERAALSVIADRCKKKGFCDLCLDEIARLAGVGRTSVQNALRKARDKTRGHISVRERPQPSGKSLTNIIKIVSASWQSWILRAIGFKRLSPSVTPVKTSLFEGVERVLSAFDSDAGAALQGNLQPRGVGWPGHKR